MAFSTRSSLVTVTPSTASSWGRVWLSTLAFCLPDTLLRPLCFMRALVGFLGWGVGLPRLTESPRLEEGLDLRLWLAGVLADTTALLWVREVVVEVSLCLEGRCEEGREGCGFPCWAGGWAAGLVDRRISFRLVIGKVKGEQITKVYVHACGLTLRAMRRFPVPIPGPFHGVPVPFQPRPGGQRTRDTEDVS